MKYIAVRTYGNGHYQNQVYPCCYSRLDWCEKKCAELNEKESCKEENEKWIPFGLYEE